MYFSRALEQLSQDIYSDDTHFVLELVQNADDNRYLEGVSPTLRFEISATDIVTTNNEVGFSEANVQALCDIKQSTKGKGGAGFIGQKGIGFKSVFAVSNDPQIHSNGFHFALEKGIILVS